MSKAEGKKIAIKFNLPLIGDVSGNESAFVVTGKEYQYTDGPDHNGPHINKAYIVDNIERYPVPRVWELEERLELPSESGEEYTSDLTGGKNYISTSEFSSEYANYMAFDDNISSFWSASGVLNQAVGVDFGEGKIITKLRILTNGRLKDFALEGSNDNSNWTNVYNGTQLSNSNWQEYTFGNLIAFRYYRVKCTSSLHTGSNVMIGEMEMMEFLSEYDSEYTYTTAAIQGTGAKRVNWTSSVPIGTSILIEYTTGTIQGDWVEVSNGEVINIDTKTLLWLRVTLSTTDTTITPTLNELWLEDSEFPQDRILLTMSDEFRNVQGDITINYNQALGNLSGQGGAVASFEEVFSPDGLDEGLTKTGGAYGSHEYITASISGSIKLIWIEKLNGYAPAEYITASVGGSIQLIHIDDINP